MVTVYQSIFDVATQTWKLVPINVIGVTPPSKYTTKPGDIVIFGVDNEIKDSNININQEIPQANKKGGYFA
jgi:hypothetical protein